MAMNATMGETPIFDELREEFGQWDLADLIGHEDDSES